MGVHFTFEKVAHLLERFYSEKRRTPDEIRRYALYIISREYEGCEDPYNCKHEGRT